MKRIFAVTLAIAVLAMPVTAAVPQAVVVEAGCDDRSSDLCAQWKAADAARDSADWGWWALWANAFTVLLVFVTLWETRKSTRAAIRSADAAVAALSADRAMVIPSTKIATLHWKLSDERRLLDYADIEVCIDWKNYGSRTALNVDPKIRISAGYGRDIVSQSPSGFLNELGIEKELRTEAKPPVEAVRDFLERGAKLYLEAEVSYNDRMYVKAFEKSFLYEFVIPGKFYKNDEGLCGIPLQEVVVEESNWKRRLWYRAYVKHPRMMNIFGNNVHHFFCLISNISKFFKRSETSAEETRTK
ncbi:MAG: hypothetical protein QM645_14075 [Asticcacaulis sp.]